MNPAKAITIIALILACLAIPAHAQAIRFDNQSTTTNAQCVAGKLCPVLAIPGTTVLICGGSAIPYASCVASPATTYTNVGAGTPCPTYAQLTLPGGANPTQCVSVSDSQGNLGAWFLPGTYSYYLTLPIGAGGGTFGPYPFSGGASAGCPLGITCDANYSTFPAACTAAGSGSIYVTRAWNGLTTQTFACRMIFVSSGVLQPGAAQVLTLSASPSCLPLQKCFDVSLGGSGSVILPNNFTPTPQNLGALGNDTGDDLIPINAAMASVASGGSVYFTGTYAYSAVIVNNGKTMRGDGPGKTVLHETTLPTCGTTTNAKTPYDNITITGSFSQVLGLSLKGPSGAAPVFCAIAQGQKGITIQPSGSLTETLIEDVEIYNVQTNGIQNWSNAAHTTLHHVIVHDGGNEGVYNTFGSGGYMVIDDLQCKQFNSWCVDTNEGRLKANLLNIDAAGSAGIFFDGGGIAIVLDSVLSTFPGDIQITNTTIVNSIGAGVTIAPSEAANTTIDNIVIDGLKVESTNRTNLTTCLNVTNGTGALLGTVSHLTLDNLNCKNTNVVLQSTTDATIKNAQISNSLSCAADDSSCWGFDSDSLNSNIQVIGGSYSGWKQGVHFQSCTVGCSAAAVTVHDNSVIGINSSALTSTFMALGNTSGGGNGADFSYNATHTIRPGDVGTDGTFGSFSILHGVLPFTSSDTLGNFTNPFSAAFASNFETTAGGCGAAGYYLGSDSVNGSMRTCTSGGVFQHQVRSSGTYISAPVGMSAPVIGGPTFTASGCGVNSLAGGTSGGYYFVTLSGTCNLVITFGGITAAHGWGCSGSNLSNPAASVQILPVSTTQCTLRTATTNGDNLTFFAWDF